VPYGEGPAASGGRPAADVTRDYDSWSMPESARKNCKAVRWRSTGGRGTQASACAVRRIEKIRIVRVDARPIPYPGAVSRTMLGSGRRATPNNADLTEREDSIRPADYASNAAWPRAASEWGSGRRLGALHRPFEHQRTQSRHSAGCAVPLLGHRKLAGGQVLESE